MSAFGKPRESGSPCAWGSALHERAQEIPHGSLFRGLMFDGLVARVDAFTSDLRLLVGHQLLAVQSEPPGLPILGLSALSVSLDVPHRRPLLLRRRIALRAGALLRVGSAHLLGVTLVLFSPECCQVLCIQSRFLFQALLRVVLHFLVIEELLRLVLERSPQLGFFDK